MVRECKKGRGVQKGVGSAMAGKVARVVDGNGPGETSVDPFGGALAQLKTQRY